MKRIALDCSEAACVRPFAERGVEFVELQDYWCGLARAEHSSHKGVAGEDRVSLLAASQGADARLEVSDDGPGIAPGSERQIFDRFVRDTGPADMAGRGGTGLGLAIVKAVASAHGGEVEAGSSAKGGARFTVRIPLAAAGAEPAPAVGERG